MQIWWLFVGRESCLVFFLYDQHDAYLIHMNGLYVGVLDISSTSSTKTNEERRCFATREIRSSGSRIALWWQRKGVLKSLGCLPWASVSFGYLSQPRSFKLEFVLYLSDRKCRLNSSEISTEFRDLDLRPWYNDLIVSSDDVSCVFLDRLLGQHSEFFRNHPRFAIGLVRTQ